MRPRRRNSVGLNADSHSWSKQTASEQTLEATSVELPIREFPLHQSLNLLWLLPSAAPRSNGRPPHPSVESSSTDRVFTPLNRILDLDFRSPDRTYDFIIVFCPTFVYIIP